MSSSLNNKITPERWKQIEEIFHGAVELGHDDRPSFIAERCGGDAALRLEVEKLLSQYDEASSFIEQPLYGSSNGGVLSALLVQSEDDPMLGKVLGSYLIEREIGRGGMGAVYEGKRADGEFRLRVAVKVVKRGIDTDFVLKRFRNERQILATLDHPYITRLIDGGTTDDGRPYFVMEYIDGLPLYRHCDNNRMSIAERLRLFNLICEAVEYAHEKRVIHRDLKPSNIIICSDGSPRLLDFGIAKLLDPSMASDTLQPTATALRMMTVDYASPEQVRGEKVTYRTDVYSLGVILFEMLTGHRPYRLTSRSPHDVARAICDEEPMLPSKAIDGKYGTPAVRVDPSALTLISSGSFRPESVAELSRILAGSLDNIVMRALRKSPDDRYQSVRELRKDIERYLNGESVSGPNYFSTRSSDDIHLTEDGSKLVAVLPLSLMNPAGPESTDEAYLTVGLADAIITRLASVQKLTVRPTSSITRYNEHYVNPFRAGLELGVDFVLDGRIRRFGERLRISLQLLNVSKGSAIWAGQFDEHLTDVLELEDAISAQVAEALIPHLTGKEKKKLAKRGTHDPQAYETYLRGRFYWNQFTAQSLLKALEAFEKAIEIDPDYALAHAGIADFYIWGNIYGLVPVRESYERANSSARRALAIDADLGEAHASLGLILLNQFEFERAESCLRKAIELNPKYSLAHEWYSALLIGIGRIEEGLLQIRMAEELDPLSLRTKTLVAWSYYQAERFDKALSKAEEIIALDESYPQGHLQRGYVLTEMGRPDEAVDSIERSLQLMPGSSLAQYALCFALSAAGSRSKSVRLAEQMIERSQREYVKPMFLAFACFASGKTGEAFRYLTIAADERDPWLAWLGTEVKFSSLREDPRFLEVLRRTRRTFVDGKVQPLPHSELRDRTSFGDVDGQTVVDWEMPTQEFAGGVLRRHYGKIAAAVLVLGLVFIAYQTGFLTKVISTDATSAANTAGRSVAVLPFVNDTGDPNNDYISDGITESLISRISGLPPIRTISRSAAFAYKNERGDPQVIGRELAVDSVLVGTLTRDNDDFVVNTALINVSDGKPVFVMSFAEKPDRILALQQIMADRIEGALGVRSSADTTVTKGPVDNNEAFQHYLKGEFHRQKGTPADTAESIANYERAIQLEPEYALAYQGLALALRSAPAYGMMPPEQAYPRAIDAARRALSLDQSLSAASVAAASIKFTYDWDYAAAEKEYKTALDLAPNNAEAHYSYGNYLVAMGRSEEALVQYRYAQQFDPLSQNIATNIGWALYIAGRYDEALVAIRQVIARDPSYGRAYINLGEILQEQGKYDEAISAIEKARELTKDPMADMALAHVFTDAGKVGEARKIAAELEEKARLKQVSPFLPAVIYAGLKENDRSFYWLERAYQERSNWLTLIKVGRRLKHLHGDPRFDDLLKRVGF